MVSLPGLLGLFLVLYFIRDLHVVLRKSLLPCDGTATVGECLSVDKREDQLSVRHGLSSFVVSTVSTSLCCK